MSEAARPDRPYPQPTAITAPFWDALADRKLLYQVGADDPRPIFPPQAFSPYDQSTDLRFVESRGKGSIYSYTIIHRPQTPAFDVPYVVAIIELDEGYTMMSNIVDADPGDVAIDARVSVDFREILPGRWIPVFLLDDH